MKTLLRNAPIGVKVSLAPMFVIFCLLLVAGMGWTINRMLIADLKQIGGQGVERVVNAQAFATQLTEMHQKVYQSLTWEGIGQRADLIKQYDAQLLQQLQAFEKSIQAASEEAGLSPAQKDAMVDFGKGFAVYAKFAKDTLDIKSAGMATAASFVPTLDGEYKNSSARIAAFVRGELGATRTSVEEAEQAAGRNSVLTVVAVLLALALSAALVFYLSRVITGPLADAAGIAGSLAQGDLTRRPQGISRDATGRVLTALQEVSLNLGQMVADIRGSADEISLASSEIAAGNADLSARSENAASSLQRTTASVGELSASIRLSSDNAAEVDQMARQAAQVAREGGRAVTEVVQTMDDISVQARKIGDIIGVIDGIAFQTNILALNAAVEAARAGEQGRGFAVVAQEVRTLAGRSAAAAREIRELIARSVEQAEAGSDKVRVAGATVGRIVESIQQVSGKVAAISEATAEQSAGVVQVNQAIIDMDQATQQNAAMVEQAMAATDSLNTQAQGLVVLLQRFRTC